jgi:hypothetical protein
MRAVRTFATVADTAGVKVAAVDHGQPTSAVTFLIKAGSRFENKPGAANALKNFAFKVRDVSQKQIVHGIYVHRVPQIEAPL